MADDLKVLRHTSTLRVEFDEAADRFIVRYTRRNWLHGLIFLTFACVWISMAWTYFQVHRHQWPPLGGWDAVVGVPIVTLVIALCVAYNLASYEELILDAGGVHHWRRIFPRRRYSPIDEIVRFRPYCDTWYAVNGRPPHGLEWAKPHGKVRCLRWLDFDDLDWLAARLNRHVRSLRGDRPAPVVVHRPGAMLVPPEMWEDARPDAWIKLKSPPATRPKLSAWRRMEPGGVLSSTGVLIFEQRGHREWGATLALLGMGLGVTALASITTIKNRGLPWTDYLLVELLTMPFKLLGLYVLCGGLLYFFEPWRRTRWIFSRHEIELRHAWGRCGRRWHWTVDRFAGLMRRPIPEKQLTNRRTYLMAGFNPIREHRYAHRLAFMLPASNDRTEPAELCSIEQLTARDAQWIGETLLRERPHWFASGAQNDR